MSCTEHFFEKKSTQISYSVKILISKDLVIYNPYFKLHLLIFKVIYDYKTCIVGIGPRVYTHPYTKNK